MMTHPLGFTLFPYTTLFRSWWIPPGSASVIESTFPEAGVYVGVDHAMSDVVKGGAFAVLAVENSTATDHPEGTCVSARSEEHMSELQSQSNLVCRLLLEKKK